METTTFQGVGASQQQRQPVLVGNLLNYVYWLSILPSVDESMNRALTWWNELTSLVFAAGLGVNRYIQEFLFLS